MRVGGQSGQDILELTPPDSDDNEIITILGIQPFNDIGLGRTNSAVRQLAEDKAMDPDLLQPGASREYGDLDPCLFEPGCVDATFDAGTVDQNFHDGSASFNRGPKK